MSRPTPKEQSRELFKYLVSNRNTPSEDIEIIANLLIHIGSELFDDLPSEDTISFDDFFKFVTEHREKNGETLANALVFQGMLMLNWLNQ